MASVADLVEEPRLLELTDPETYEAGMALAETGAVVFDELGPLRVRARVDDGEDVWVVELRSGMRKLTWTCSEPGGARDKLCPHLVAAGIETRRQAPDRSEPAVAKGSGAPETGAAPATERVAAPPPAVEAAPVSEERAPPPPVTEKRAARPPDAGTPAPRPGAGTPAAPATTGPMPATARISGVHAILFTPAAAEARSFLADVLGLASVEAADGWPIFALPPAELAVHPDDAPRHELWLQCDDLEATLEALELRGVRVDRPIRNEAWGRSSTLHLPGGLDIPIYEPAHPSPLPGFVPDR